MQSFFSLWDFIWQLRHKACKFCSELFCQSPSIWCISTFFVDSHISHLSASFNSLDRWCETAQLGLSVFGFSLYEFAIHSLSQYFLLSKWIKYSKLPLENSFRSSFLLQYAQNFKGVPLSSSFILFKYNPSLFKLSFKSFCVNIYRWNEFRKLQV